MEKKTVIYIDWWLGRVIAMSGAITTLAKAKPVSVITSWPLVFRGNPYIKSVHWTWDRALWEQVIKWNDYIVLEPYQDAEFFNDWKNWLDIAAKILWVEKTDPQLFLAEHEKLNLLCNDCRPVLFQPFGSTMLSNWADKSYRSFKIEDAQYIANWLISAWYTPYTVEKDDQPKLQWCRQLTVEDMRFLVTLAYKYPVVWVDSCMHHAAKAFWNSAVVMRAWTDAGRFWYDTSINLRNEEAKYEYVPFRLGIDFNTDIQNQYTNIFDKEFLDNFTKHSIELCNAFYSAKPM